MSPIPLGIFAAAGAGGGGGAAAYELISTTTLGSDTSSVTFSSIDSTYKHLQIRFTARSNYNNTFDVMYVRLNGDSGGNYRDHWLLGDGSSVQSELSGASGMNTGWLSGNTATANSFGAGVFDLLDYTSTTKNKTARSLAGSYTGGLNRIYLRSGLWVNTAAVSSVTLLPVYGSNFKTYSRFSLYGIKG